MVAAQRGSMSSIAMPRDGAELASAAIAAGARPGTLTRLRGTLRADRVLVAALLLGTAILYLWNLAASGWANAYYSAAALAGSQSWLAFLFGSFDASNAITVDKTPASIWVMALSARIFGFGAWSVLVPQALMGVASVALLFLGVRRRFGTAAGLLAGATLALTPAAALMFRFNNPDALLTLLFVAAAYATIRALEGASTRWLLVAGVALGFAFMTKMLAGLLLVPVLAGVYLLAAPTGLGRRLRQLGLAAVAIVVSSGWWVALVMLWPAAARPYIGGSQTNSVIELMLGYNGFGRITGNEIGRVGAGGPFGERAGILRLFTGQPATEIAWLLPVALLAVVGLLWARRSSPRTDPARAQVLLWGGWLVVVGLVFSLMEGIFHAYYAVALAPAIAALVAMGTTVAWQHRVDARVRVLAAAVVAGGAAWVGHLLARSPDWLPWLLPLVLCAGLLAALGFLARAFTRSGMLRVATASLAIVALLAGPAAASIATAAEPHTGAIPGAAPAITLAARRSGQAAWFRAPNVARATAGMPFVGMAPHQRAPRFGWTGAAPIPMVPSAMTSGGPRALGRGAIGGLLDAASPRPELVAALQSNADAYRWTAATTGANNAAGLQLSSGTPVMAIGGFNGSDPFPTLAQFQAYVARGEIHWYVAGADAGGFPGTMGGADAPAQIADWVATHFEATTLGGVTVYDLSTGS
jgi:4-amino-4-deoxy-L-arabinose transferase-like glycosyltransferase